MFKNSEKRSPFHDKPLRYPGQSIDDEIDKVYDNEILEAVVYATVFIIITILSWVNYFTRTFTDPIIMSIGTIIIVLIAAVKIINAGRKLKLLKLGRDGEKIVAEYLEELKREGDTIFHDIVGNKFNIDHVVVSKHGIFVIETKTRSKPLKGNPSVTYDGHKIFVDGIEPERNAIEQVTALSRWLEKEIKLTTGKYFPIRPVIVFPGWYVEPIPSGSAIWILNPKALISFIHNEPISISDTDLCLIAFHLSRYIKTRY
jgi:hypothetical protein